ncbi:acyl carrier protein [Dactylosporangium sp. NPDC051485]|uniref:acyl carrier protein n=1 Tax=Dactylosporangium sp. NPDC051485 TaxID=3154846 RepID=UPI00343B2F89
MTALRERVAELTSEASDGDVTADEILVHGGSLIALGVSSLATMRLIAAVEVEFGVELDLDTLAFDPDDFDDLVRHLAERGARAADG